MEQIILDWIQASLRTWLGDVLMPLFSHMANYGGIWILLTLVLLARPKTRRTGLAIAIALIAELALCNLVLKPLAARPRPFLLRPELTLLIPVPTDFSFPSGHAAASFAVTTALLARRSRLGWAALILAALIAFSRLYMYVHYPTDVLAGILLGVVTGLLGAWLVSRKKRAAA